MSKVKVAKVSDVPDGDLKKVEVNGQPVALFKIDGKIYATTNICPHEECTLDENHMMHGEVVECTCHGSQFKVSDGSVLVPPATEPLKTYLVSVEEEEVFIESE